MTTPKHHLESDPAVAARRSADDVLLAELSEPPALDEARESLAFWQHRLAKLPVYKRSERKEAQLAVERWQQHVHAAERARYGPSLIEQLLQTLGIRWRPRLRRLIAGLGALVAVVVVLLVALVVAVVAFWPELEPIVRALLDNRGGGDG